MCLYLYVCNFYITLLTLICQYREEVNNSQNLIVHFEYNLDYHLNCIRSVYETI